MEQIQKINIRLLQALDFHNDFMLQSGKLRKIIYILRCSSWGNFEIK
ncbi:unnamed protein product [Paramecium octaurelia]|uniref:Uncharacterized protein n=1 Tax=Paramecium octaurelia TaxID=43137 RepID=A0A8S1W728_PAROT|nr:unnamed protein product [Paramecium octaurelia]